eukprot:5660936-Pyramimonas_sp.AAC.1
MSWGPWARRTARPTRRPGRISICHLSKRRCRCWKASPAEGGRRRSKQMRCHPALIACSGEVSMGPEVWRVVLERAVGPSQ